MRETTSRGAAAAVLALALAACEIGTGGVSGNLQFRDLTQSVPVDIAGHVDQPMAVGGLLALEVEEGTPGQDADLVAASSSDPGVFVVESFSLGRAMLRGVGPGRAFLDVTTRGGTEDSIAVAVAAIDGTEILLLPWDPLLLLPESLWADGAVMLPDSLVDLFARHRNDEGTILTGYGAADWSLTEGADATLTPKDRTDFATLHSGEALEPFTVATTAGAALELETVAESEVARLALLVQGTGAEPTGDGETMRLEGDSSYLFHVVAYTQDDRYVIGAGDEAFTVEAPQDDATIFRVSSAPSGSNEALDRALTNGRAFLAEVGLPGTTEVTVGWAGLTLSVTLQVLAPTE